MDNTHPRKSCFLLFFFTTLVVKSNSCSRINVSTYFTQATESNPYLKRLTGNRTIIKNDEIYKHKDCLFAKFYCHSVFGKATKQSKGYSLEVGGNKRKRIFLSICFCSTLCLCEVAVVIFMLMLVSVFSLSSFVISFVFVCSYAYVFLDFYI